MLGIAQRKLQVALQDPLINLTVCGDCLQVFYQLHNLPNILMLSIDTAIRSAIDISSVRERDDESNNCLTHLTPPH